MILSSSFEPRLDWRQRREPGRPDVLKAVFASSPVRASSRICQSLVVPAGVVVVIPRVGHPVTPGT